MSEVEIEVRRGCVQGSTPPGYRLAADAHVAAAQLLGSQMARRDDESQADAAQDAVVAYLEELRAGTTVVRAKRLKQRLLAVRGDRNHRRPLLSRSYAEGLEPLPVWCE